jgi:hypothetical protein
MAALKEKVLTKAADGLFLPNRKLKTVIRHPIK